MVPKDRVRIPARIPRVRCSRCFQCMEDTQNTNRSGAGPDAAANEAPADDQAELQPPSTARSGACRHQSRLSPVDGPINAIRRWFQKEQEPERVGTARRQP